MSLQHGAAQANLREYSIANADNGNLRAASTFLLIEFNNVCGVIEFHTLELCPHRAGGNARAAVFALEWLGINWIERKLSLCVLCCFVLFCC